MPSPPPLNGPFRIIGVDSSPYTTKLRAVFRYRHIEHVWQCRMPQFFEETQHVRPGLMPVLADGDGNYLTDSTPLILALESTGDQERRVLPDDHGRAFVAALIEDMADEWLTKVLFYYRFKATEAGRHAAGWVSDDTLVDASREALSAATTSFHARQLERLPIVGATDAHADLLDSTLTRILSALEGAVANERFLFGTRPSLADFGLIAQLSTLERDWAGSAVMRASAPRTEAWTRRGTDLSGVTGAWGDEPMADNRCVMALLKLTGEIYLPYLDANATALASGRDHFTTKLAGHEYGQAPFRYQAKCLRELRQRYQALSAQTRARIGPALDATDCLPLLERSV
ncbi:MAG: glutathione S-transferase N-terminal domain-containing protein [Pseudomonadota bacterium]